MPCVCTRDGQIVPLFETQICSKGTNPTNVPWPIVLQTFCPPLFKYQDNEKFNLLCPVRALDTYVHRAALWRKSDQLLVLGPLRKAFLHPNRLLANG